MRTKTKLSTLLVAVVAFFASMVMFLATNTLFAKASAEVASYTDLQNAITNAIDDTQTTITLTSDITLAGTDTYIHVPNGKVIVLDLAGYTISQQKEQTAGYQMLLNDGDLTIEDSVGGGKLSYTDIGTGGEYISDTIYNRATITVNGGTIENISSEAVANAGYPHALDTYSGIRNTSVTINGGTIYCENYSAIRMFCVSATYNADLVINGGTIKGAIDMQNGTMAEALGTLEINGGNFKITANVSNVRFANWNGGATTYGIEADVNDGYFEGGFATTYVPAAADFDEQIISGGTFEKDMSEYIEPGATEVFYADGTPQSAVGETNTTTPVASVGSKYYVDLQKAVDNAVDGDTITLLQNVEVDAILTIADKNLTIDGNYNTLSSTGAQKKVVEIYNNSSEAIVVTFTNIEIIANDNELYGGRCIDTRTDGITLNLNNVRLISNSTTTSQTLTIGGTEQDEDVNVNLYHVEIIAGDESVGNYGYGIISFVPVNLAIEESNIVAWGSVYLKEDAAGSIVSIYNSAISSINQNGADDASNTFGAVNIEASDVELEIENTLINIDLNENFVNVLGAVIVLDCVTLPTDVSVSLSGSTTVTGLNENGIVIANLESNEIEISADLGCDMSEFVASNGYTYYQDLQDAIDNAVDGDTITLLQDVAKKNNYDPVVVEGKSITFDLNGNTLYQVGTQSSGLSMAILVVRYGAELTLIDSVGGGAIKALGTAVQLEGTLNLAGATIAISGTPTGADTDGGMAYPIWVYAKNDTIKPVFNMISGALVIDENYKDFEYAYGISFDDAWGTLDRAENITISISGGEIDGNLAMSSDATISITGGVFEQPVADEYMTGVYAYVDNGMGGYVIIERDDILFGINSYINDLLNDNKYSDNAIQVIEGIRADASLVIPTCNASDIKDYIKNLKYSLADVLDDKEAFVEKNNAMSELINFASTWGLSISEVQNICAQMLDDAVTMTEIFTIKNDAIAEIEEIGIEICRNETIVEFIEYAITRGVDVATLDQTFMTPILTEIGNATTKGQLLTAKQNAYTALEERLLLQAKTDAIEEINAYVTSLGITYTPLTTTIQSATTFAEIDVALETLKLDAFTQFENYKSEKFLEVSTYAADDKYLTLDMISALQNATSVSQIDSSVNVIKTQIDTLKQNDVLAGNIDSNILLIANRVDAILSNFDAYSDNFDDVVDDLETELASIIADLATLEESAGSTNTSVVDLQSKLQTTQEKIAEVKSIADAVNTSNTEIKESNSDNLIKILLYVIIGLLVVVVIILLLKKGSKNNPSNDDKQEPKKEETITETEQEEVEEEPVVEEAAEETAIEEEAEVQQEVEDVEETADEVAEEQKEVEEATPTAEEGENPFEETDDAVLLSGDGSFLMFQGGATKSFADRLENAEPETKQNFEELKNEFLSFKKISERTSKQCISFRSGRTLLAKMVLRGKSINCYFALDVNEYPTTVYHQRDNSDKKAYSEVPFTVRVRSHRSLKNAKKLINEVATKNGLVKK